MRVCTPTLRQKRRRAESHAELDEMTRSLNQDKVEGGTDTSQALAELENQISGTSPSASLRSSPLFSSILPPLHPVSLVPPSLSREPALCSPLPDSHWSAIPTAKLEQKQQQAPPEPISTSGICGLCVEGAVAEVIAT
jgi:hypothetical protein